MIVSRFWQKDARFRGYVFVYRAMFMRTYSAIGDVSGLDSDCFSSSGCQARRLCGDFALKAPPMWISISNFSRFFFSFGLAVSAVLRSCSWCAWLLWVYVIALGQELGFNPCALKILRYDLITIDKVSKTMPNPRFCSQQCLIRIWLSVSW